jgi:archaemetzincin
MIRQIMISLASTNKTRLILMAVLVVCIAVFVIRLLDREEGFEKLGRPEPGDWRYEVKERTQSFQEYVRANPNRPVEGKRTVCFQPVGPFTPSEQTVLMKAVAFAGLYFRLPVEIGEPLPLPERGWSRRREQGGRTWVQYKAAYFLNELLPKRLPPQAYAYLAVTMGDLYPEESWNYVFGMASLKDRVGVYSLSRYFAEFWGQKPTTETERLALLRAMKVITHEAGHMFGIYHCQKWKCNMNGSMSLAESDNTPIFLCPDCLKKLQWNIGFDTVSRYEEMEKFLREEKFVEEADWLKRRIQRLRK